MARFSIYFFCLPISLPSTPLISGDQERIYWDHFSTKGIAPEVLIDHLVVCTLSHAELKSHKHPFHSFKLQSFTGAHSLCRRPDTVNNNSDPPSSLPKQTHGAYNKEMYLNTPKHVQVLTNKTFCLAGQTKKRTNKKTHSFQVTPVQHRCQEGL